MTGVVVGAFDYPLISFGLTVALERDDRVELLAAGVSEDALATVLARDSPGVAVLDGRRADRLAALRSAASASPATRLVLLADHPPSASLLELVADGASCLSARAAVPEILAAILLSARGQSVIASEELVIFSPRGHRAAALTAREREVLAHLERGETDDEIGRALQVSVATVRTHNTHIYRKLGATRRELLQRGHR